MTLQEKFKDVIEDAITHNQQYDSFEQIAEEFAIGFAEWMNKTENRLGYNEGKNRWYHFDSGKWITTKELLEIYKKTL